MKRDLELLAPQRRYKICLICISPRWFSVWILAAIILYIISLTLKIKINYKAAVWRSLTRYTDERMKLGIKAHADSVHVKFKKVQNSSMMTKLRNQGCVGEKSWEGPEGGIWGTGNVPKLDMGGGGQ